MVGGVKPKPRGKTNWESAFNRPDNFWSQCHTKKLVVFFLIVYGKDASAYSPRFRTGLKVTTEGIHVKRNGSKSTEHFLIFYHIRLLYFQ